MNFQEKVFESTADLRDRANTIAAAATKRVDELKGSLSKLSSASRAFSKIARTHASRFVKQNSELARDASKDVSELARATYATFSATARKPRPAVRKRGTRKAA